jgi:hypothetical protein
MNHTRRISTAAPLSVTLAVAYLVIATSARAVPRPPADTPISTPPSAPTTFVSHGGTPTWAHLIIALVAAALALAIAWTVNQ